MKLKHFLLGTLLSLSLFALAGCGSDKEPLEYKSEFVDYEVIEDKDKISRLDGIGFKAFKPNVVLTNRYDELVCTVNYKYTVDNEWDPRDDSHHDRFTPAEFLVEIRAGSDCRKLTVREYSEGNSIKGGGGVSTTKTMIITKDKLKNYLKKSDDLLIEDGKLIDGSELSSPDKQTTDIELIFVVMININGNEVYGVPTIATISIDSGEIEVKELK